MRNISKSFPGVKALNGFSIDLKAGEVHALVGENGAGKSTLIKTLYGIHQPDGGEIVIDGVPTKINGPADALSKGIGVVFQELSVCPHLDIANNIFLGCIKNKHGVIDDRLAHEEAARLMEEAVGLRIPSDTPMKDLSIADQQMVEITKVTSKGCRIVVFDEPTSSLTENEIERLFKIIFALKKKGVGIIYISHRLEELPVIADRITVMRDGTRVKTMDYKDTNDNEIISLMVGRELSNIYPTYKRTIGEVVFEADNIRQGTKLDVKHLDVRKGEILGIAGLVGAGRTETLRALFGADEADEKHVKIEGKEYTFNNPSEAIAAGFVYMTENRKFDGAALGLSVEENITMASLRKFSKRGRMQEAKAKSNAQEYCKRLNIRTPSIDQKVMNLSGGNQQKVIIGKWLTRTAKVMVFDEPTRGIDVGAKYEIYSLMNDLSDQGIAIIMISSDLPEILGMSDRVAVFKDGRVTAVLDRKDADSETIMKYATGKLS
ncbi:MAG: sugar ABC transporter ATP-binding protein [Firmicutes bacterium]|nr:sugar ABC transporter ATP-binding protein [Bacillota bacterium]